MNRFVKLILALLNKALPPLAEHDSGNPFEYVTILTQDLELGDYLVAYDAYIQRISAEDAYTGQRRIVCKKGHGIPVEIIADYDEEFTVRQLKEVL